MQYTAGSARLFWPPFEEKISNFNSNLCIKDVFERYTEHILHKFIANGYDRIEFRALLICLKEYDIEGNFVKVLGDNSFA